ncbi:MAG: hypothetical protein AABX12_04295 [Nanoarchaeota archaeon]
MMSRMRFKPCPLRRCILEHPKVPNKTRLSSRGEPKDFLMQHKGLMKNFVYIVIAVIGLLVFIAGVYKLYQVGVNQESENAKKTLGLIMAKVEALPEESSNLFSFQGFSKNAWYLAGWNDEDVGKPVKCLKNCICICKDAASAAACDSREGFCQSVNAMPVLVHTLPFSVLESSSAGVGAATTTTGLAHRACIFIPPNLFEISIHKASSLVLEDASFHGQESFDTFRPCRYLEDDDVYSIAGAGAKTKL